MNETAITIVGNVTADPELRFTSSGVPVANFSVASTPRTFNKLRDEWEDGTTAFYPVTVWRDQAENVAEHVRRGKRVIVHGTIGQRNWEDKTSGDQRSRLEVTATDVGLSLQFLKPVTPEEPTTTERPADRPARKTASPTRKDAPADTAKV